MQILDGYEVALPFFRIGRRGVYIGGYEVAGVEWNKNLKCMVAILWNHERNVKRGMLIRRDNLYMSEDFNDSLTTNDFHCFTSEYHTF